MTRRTPAALWVALFACAAAASAQEPQKPPRDTARAQPDTALAPQDTTQATKVLADSLKPVQQLVRHDLGPAHGITDGVWVWDREALLLEAPTTVAQLLERIPGLLVIRSGFYLQPEAATSMGGIGNRVEVWLDGFALDPLLESSVDFSKIELAELHSVRVERRLGTVRIQLETLAPTDSRPYSMIEAGVSQPNANLFRGLLLVPRMLFGPLGLAIDRMDTNGKGGDEPADQFAGWAKWAFVRNGHGLQVEYRRVSTDRDPSVPWNEKHIRDDIMVRGRARLAPGLVAELFGGQSNLSVEPTVAGGDSLRVEEKSKQYGGRISFASPIFWANGAYRTRNAEKLPSSQIDGAAGVSVKYGAAGAQVTKTDWRDAGSATELTLHAEAGPPALRIFGETTSSDRGVPYLADSTGVNADAVITTYDGYRVGATANVRGITLAGAMVHAETDSVTTFGLPFDRTRRLFSGGNADGWEISGRIPLPLIKGLYGQGMITDWRSGNVWIYMPSRIYRAGLGLHAIPLQSGNLEILGRLEMIHRGQMQVPDFETEGGTTVLLPAVDYIDSYLEIRIIDVRAFMHYDDLSGQKVANLPGRSLPGPRIIYGVKWQFFN